MGIVFALLSMLCFAGNIFITRVAMSRMGANTGFPVVLIVNVAFAALVFGIERLISLAPFDALSPRTAIGAGMVLIGIALLAFR